MTYPLTSVVPGTDRHDWDEVEERGVIPGTRSRGKHEDWSASTPPSLDPAPAPPTPTHISPPCPPYSSDMMITGDRVPPVSQMRSLSIGVASLTVGRQAANKPAPPQAK